MTEAWLDRIHISDLLLRCLIGVNPDERREKQDVNINITLFADLKKASKSDDIADTVDYKTIKKKVITMVEGSSYFLVEKLADRIAEICLENERVVRARVRVAKPGALRFARSVDVEIERGRESA
jgi:FolB domain-containing protein